MKQKNETPNFLKMGEELIRDLLIVAEKEGLDFIHRNFEKEGFMDSSFTAWPQRKQPIDYKLLRVTNTLFNSISADSDVSTATVTFSSDEPYAKLHNEGGFVKISRTAKMRKFFWAMYKQTKEEKWKYMAMSKKPNLVFRVPKRQFMGESANFNERFNRKVVRIIQNKFKQEINE